MTTSVVRARLIPLLLLAVMLLQSCALPEFVTPAPPQAAGLVNTLAAQTWEVLAEQIRLSATVTPSPPPSLTSTSTQTQAPVPYNTVTSPPTNTPVPSFTPRLTDTPPPPSTPAFTLEPGQTAAPCNSAQFIDSVTVPPRTKLPPSSNFTKVWRIKNTGSCAWNEAYSLVFMSGERMDGKATPLRTLVYPGESVDLAVNLVSPGAAGNYKSNWMLKVGDITFGWGINGGQPFPIQIEVVPSGEHIIFNFAQSFCSARWESGSGALPCPGSMDDSSGFVILLEKPKLETRTEDEPALWMQPNTANEGMIVGTYPAIAIQKGDHFLASIGCLGLYRQCDVTFELHYRVGGRRKQLGQWRQVYDKSIDRIDIDLSDLAGESVIFILVVNNNAGANSKHAAAFWLMPQIRRP